MEEKNNKWLIWLIVILIVLVLGLVGYIIYDKNFTNSEELSDNNTTTTTIKNDIAEEEILRRDNFIYELNNEEHHISYVYKYLSSDKFYANDENFDKEAEELAKENNEYVYNLVYMEILLDEIKIENIEIPLYYDTSNIGVDNLINNVEIISSETIHKINGDDNEYFVFTIPYEHLFIDGGTNPFVVDEEGKVLYTLEFDLGTGWETTDENSLMYGKGMYSIENNTLYYLMPNCEKTNDTTEYFNQYLLEVKEGKVYNKQIGIYEGYVAGGDICSNE